MAEESYIEIRKRFISQKIHKAMSEKDKTYAYCLSCGKMLDCEDRNIIIFDCKEILGSNLPKQVFNNLGYKKIIDTTCYDCLFNTEKNSRRYGT